MGRVAYNRFAFDLFRVRLGEAADNFVRSPYGFAVALSMLYAGAEGAVVGAILDTLRFDDVPGRFHQAVNAVDRRLSEPTNAGTRPVRIANAIWASEDLPVSERYLELLRGQYGAGVAGVDLATPEGLLVAADLIDRWADRQTGGVIPQVTGGDGLALCPSPCSSVFVANAVHFKAEWPPAGQFDLSATVEWDFHLAGGETVRAPTMRREAAMAHREGDS